MRKASAWGGSRKGVGVRDRGAPSGSGSRLHEKKKIRSRNLVIGPGGPEGWEKKTPIRNLSRAGGVTKASGISFHKKKRLGVRTRRFSVGELGRLGLF